MDGNPWTSATPYDEMPESLQEEVNEMAEVYAQKDLEEGTVNGESIAIFHVGEGTLTQTVLDEVDYTDDQQAIIEGNSTAAVIEKTANEIIESTEIETVAITDRSQEEIIYKESVEPNIPPADRAQPSNIIREIGEHYERPEFERRVEEHREQLWDALSDVDSDTRREVIEAHKDAYDSADSLKSRSSTPYSAMLENAVNLDIGVERIAAALDETDVNTKPVFARTMSVDYVNELHQQKNTL